MRTPRIYHPELIHQLGNITLSDEASAHIGRVLRMKPQQDIVLFDGSGNEFPATIIEVNKKTVQANVLEQIEKSSESL